MYKFDKLKMILFWWIFWFLVASTNEDIKIDFSVSILLALFIASLIMGYMASFELKRKYVNPKPVSIRYIYGIIIIQMAIISVLYGLYSLNFYEVRMHFFGMSNQSLFQKFVLYGYGWVIIPIFIYVLARNSAARHFENIKYTSLVVVVLDTFISAGRFGIYFYIFFVVYNANINTSNFIRFFIGSILIVLASMILFAMRYNLEVSIADFNDYLIESMINYHIAPFQILSDAINTPFKYEGILVFGVIADLVGFIFSAFGKTSSSSFGNFGAYLNEIYITIGNTQYNAFGTNLLPVFLDGGYLGVFIYFFVAGFILKMNRKNEFGIIILFNLIMGLFQPIMTSTLFFIPTILFFYKLCLRSIK